MTLRPDFGDDVLAELHVGALEPHHQRHLQADVLDGRDHALGDDVAAHDAAEDVDQDALHVRSAVMILKAAVTFSLVAPPPTSRKLAGASP